MTTIQSSRSLPMTAPRATPAPSQGLGVPTIDPIKLLQRYKWLLAIAAGAGAVLGTIAHVVWLYVAPVWTPEMIFQCDGVKSDMSTLVTSTNDKENDRFMATQVQIMLSNRIADRAAADPALLREAPQFAQQFMTNGTLNINEVSRILRKRIGAGVLGETQLIRLTFWDTDPNVATAVLKIVGDTYRTDRDRQFESENKKRVKDITSQVGELNKKIENDRDKRKRLLQDQKLDSLDTATNESRSRMTIMQENLAKLVIERQGMVVQRDDMERQLASPAGLAFSDTIRQKVQEHPVMLRLNQDLAAQEAYLTGLKARLGPEHRTVRQVMEGVEGMRQAVERKREELQREEFNALLDKLKSGIQANEAAASDYQKQFEDARARAQELTQTITAVKEIDDEILKLNEQVAKFEAGSKNFEVLTQESRVKVLQDPIVPKQVSFPKLQIMLPLGIFAALGLTAAFVVVRELLDQRVKSPADIAIIPRTRVLGLVPHASEDPGAPPRIETVFRDQPRGIIAESYRQLRGSLWKRMQQGGYRTLAVMSGMPQSGATTVAINLAYAFAAAEHRVLLIDANLRRPAVHKVLGVQDAPGLADVLAGATPLASAVQHTDSPLLSVLSAGSAGKRVYERLSSVAFSELLASTAGEYDIVLLDVAPAMVAGDALAVANRCDASLLVVRALGEKRGMVARIRNDLSEAKAEFMGVLVNAVRSSAGGYLKGNIMAAHAYQTGEGESLPKES